MKVAVAKDKFARGFDGTGREVSDAYAVVDLRAALERVYGSDAHLVTYVVDGASRQPRLNKPGLGYFERPVRTTTFMCDVDNPGHAEWSEGLLAKASEQYATLEPLATCGVYHTAHGRRIVQPLAEPIPVAEVEPYLRRWLLQLESAGLAVDWACRDWTRHFRLPHVRRSGRPYRSPLVRLERMRPIALAPLPKELTPAPAAPRAPRQAPVIAWTNDLPEHWRERSLAIAKAIREHVTEQWHEMYMALGGALLSRGCPPERLPTLITWIASAAGSVKPWNHGRSARDTAERRAAGLATTGYRALQNRWPRVADALDEVTATRTEARLRQQAKAASGAPPLEEAVRALTDTIRNAPDGLTVISAECGIGKTHAATVVAAERAAKPYASADAKGLRAPPMSKTSISVDKNKLAEQIADELRAQGTPVRRIFGPLSVIGDDGKPVCRYHNVARPLVDGGQPMQWELCQGRGVERCEVYDQCRARDGVDGEDDARVTVGPHALVSELDAAAGSTGLLVIDEPPAALETITLTKKDFDDARARMGSFDSQFAEAMRPVVEAIDAWREIADPDAVVEPVIALKQVRGSDAAGDVLHAVKKAIPQDRRSKAPPILRQDIFVAKRSEGYATQLGAASRVLGVLHRVLTTSERVAMRVEDERVVITTSRTDFADALRRQGSVVVTDANADIHLPVFAKIVGYEPRFHRFAAVDGAAIRRTLLRSRSATRRGWFAHGRIVLDAGVVSAVSAAVAWAREEPSCRTLGLITMRILRIMLDAAWRPTDSAVDEQWRELRQSKSALAEAREKLGPVLRAWPGKIAFGHYGAVRGLNSMADVDALITLGDPWPNLGEVRNDVAFLGLEGTWEDRLEAMCRAELEQAHGRLRAVHRARTGRALHVGSVLPSGYGWTSGGVDVRTLSGADVPSNMSASRCAELVEQLGGVCAAARSLGCSRKTISRYTSAERAIPIAVAIDLERVARSTSQGVHASH